MAPKSVYACCLLQKTFWLTGGLRRAALGFALMKRLAENHMVISPDYPLVPMIDEFINAFDSFLQNEELMCLVLAGQPYGGMLAQAYLTHRGNAIEHLILSSTGPADWGVWATLQCSSTRMNMPS
jgi:pimeloyl-ACP methyl ester carboxylesterase